MYDDKLTLDAWIWWVSSIIYCTNAHFRIIYIVPSVHFFLLQPCGGLKKNVDPRQTADQGRTQRLHHKAVCCGTADREIKAGLRGPLPLFDPALSGAPLKSPNCSHRPHLVSGLPLKPGRGMLSAHYATLPTQRGNGSKCKRSASNLRPLRFTYDTSAKLCLELGPLVSCWSIPFKQLEFVW